MNTSPTPPDRITMRSIFQNVIDTFDVNKGFLRTYRLLTVSPGHSMRTWLFEDRTVLTKPFKLLVVSTAVVVFLLLKVVQSNEFVRGFQEGAGITTSENVEQGAEATEQETAKKESEMTAVQFQEFFNRYFNLVILISIPFMALGTFWLFGKKEFNYAEHIVFNTYVLSYQNMLVIVMLPLFMLVSSSLAWGVYFLIAYAYFIYAAVHFFQIGVWKGIGRSLSALSLGSLIYFVFIVLLIVIGVLFYVKVIKGT